jgi:UDP-N-acetyl-D-glucosamine dehydrogenase
MATPTMVETRSPAAQLEHRIQTRTATIGVVGLGYVGLPLLRAFFQAGFPVLGYDVDTQKIDMLRRGESYLKHLGEDFVKALAESPKFHATADPAALAKADAIILCVPTPLGRHGEPDMSYIVKSTEMVAKVLRPGQIVSLESTTYPGTTRGDCLPILARTGLVAGRDYFLAFSPEREDPGRSDHSTQTIPKLVGGIDAESGRLANLLYAAAIRQVVPVDSAEIAEAAKLLENIYRCVNIALVNELKPVLAAMDIDIWKVIDAAKTKPFGFQAFYPGPGLGGHCIPIDPFYLTWKAREFGHHTRFIELAGEINNSMPHYVIRCTSDGLNECGKPLRGSKVLVIGLAYKPDVDDVRETPAAEIIKLLFEHGADVSYHDPHVPLFAGMRKYMEYRMHSVPLSPEVLKNADCVLVVTNHKVIDWAAIAAHARLVVDSRNALAPYLPIQGKYVQA